MSQEINTQNIAEKIISTFRQFPIKELYMMNKNDFNNFKESKMKDFKKIEVQYQKDEMKRKEMMKHMLNISIDHSYMINVRDESYKVMAELNSLFENIKTATMDINQTISGVIDSCTLIESKVSQLEEYKSELQSEMSEKQEEIDREIRTSKEKSKAIQLKVSLKEESFAATEKVRISKGENLENLRKDYFNLQEELHCLSLKNIDQRLNQLHLSKEEQEAKITAINIDLQNAIDDLQNAERLGDETKSNITKIDSMIIREEEKASKLRECFIEKQNLRLSLLKNKADLEAKKVYDENMAIALILSDELAKSKKIQEQTEDTKQKIEEIKQKIDETREKLNERKMNIKNIEENLKLLQETVSQSTSAVEIEALNEEIKDLDNTISQLQSKIDDLKSEIKNFSDISLSDLFNVSTNSENEDFINGSNTTDCSFSVDIESIISSLSVKDAENKIKNLKKRAMRESLLNYDISNQDDKKKRRIN